MSFHSLFSRTTKVAPARDRRMRMMCTPPVHTCAILMVALAALGSAAMPGCGNTSHTPNMGSDAGPPDAPGTTTPPQVIDPWHHHAGAGDVIEPGQLIATSPTTGAFT